MNYYKDQLTHQVFAYDDEQVANGFLKDTLTAMTNEEITAHLNPSMTKKQRAEDVFLQKKGLMGEANEHIAILQDAIDLDMSTAQEKQQLKEWKTYRVLLSRIDTTADKIEWPDVP